MSNATRGKPPESLAEAPPHYHGHRDRLRTRLREAGADALADYELLELLLFRGIPRRDVKPLAKALLARFGSFPEVISAPPARLAEMEGLGEAAITELKIVQAAAQRLARGEMNGEPCSHHGLQCSTIVVPCRPSRTRSSSGCFFSISAIS